MKKRLFISTGFILFNLLSYAQEKNVLFNAYTIGDSIKKHADNVYRYDNKNKLYIKADKFDEGQYVYFPEAEDSSVFPLLKFKVVILRNDKEGTGTVNSIWLMDPISSDTTMNNVFVNYTTIKNYLDQQLIVKAEEHNSDTYFGNDFKNWVWRTENLDYHLNCHEIHDAKDKKTEKKYQVTVIID